MVPQRSRSWRVGGQGGDRHADGDECLELGAGRVLNEENHGPFGERNLIIPNGHWLCGPSQALSPFLRAGSGRVVR